MGTVTPITYIELTDDGFGALEPVIAGTRITVQDVAIWYVVNQSSLGWIVDNFSITPAQVYAALSYYYDHQAQIDAAIAAADQRVRSMALTLDDLKAKIKARQND